MTGKNIAEFSGSIRVVIGENKKSQRASGMIAKSAKQAK
jgi:hypothetical protein